MARKKQLPPGVLDIRAPQRPLLHDDDVLDDVCTLKSKDTSSKSSMELVGQLKALGFMGAEAFVARHPMEVILEAVESVTEERDVYEYEDGRAVGKRQRRIAKLGLKNPGGLIRWLVKEAMAHRVESSTSKAADSGVSDGEEEPRPIKKRSRPLRMDA